MNAFLVDDEVNNIDNLQSLLAQYCPDVVVTGRALHADAARELLTTSQPELIFLDIQMPGQNGFELLKSLPNRHFEVIFVTGYDHFGIQAIRFSAIDYLLKPIDPVELQDAVQRVRDRLAAKKQNLQLDNLMQLLLETRQKSEHRIALSTTKETRFVKTADIIRCEADNNYTTFYLKTSEKLVVSRPMFEFDEILTGYGFLRCHHSHLVNIVEIHSLIKEDSGYLLLSDGSRIPVSRLKKDQVKAALQNG